MEIRNKMATIALVLLLTIGFTLVAIPVANAQVQRQTYCFIGAIPNPVGVNQEVLLHIGITLQLQAVQMGWDGLTVTIVRPDGKTETLGPYRTDSTGGTGVVYRPTLVGNYTLQAHFPQQVTTSTNYGPGAAPNTTMLASDSPKVTLVVLPEPLQYYPGVPLPTEYWTRPINQQFREWYTVAGSSWMSNEYNEGPETPHILWTKPLTTGGLAGGSLGLVGSGPMSVGMETGDAYEGKWSSRLALAGKLYYQAGAYDRPRLWYCVDLRTGEELWAKTFLDNQSISFGQLLYFQGFNYMGTFAYLWVTVGTTWTAFDAFTGEWRAAITNMPSGTRVEGPRGEIYIYSVSLTGGYMQLWNLTAFVVPATGMSAGSWGSQFSLRQFNASSGTYRSLQTNGTLGSEVTTGAAERAARAWAWNITIPGGLVGSVRAINWTDGRVVGSNVNTTHVDVWAFAIPPIGTEGPIPNPPPAGSPGTLLYRNVWTAPSDWLLGNQSVSWVATDLTYNFGAVWSKETFQHYFFDLTNGKYLGVTEPMEYQSTYSVSRRMYRGYLYATSGYGGTVYCYDPKTAKTLWTYSVKQSYPGENLWGNNWPIFIYFATGGKIYLFHQEHSANQPLPRLAAAICLDATSGEVIWRVDGLFRTTSWGGSPIMADSVIAMYNTYDQQVYAIGKGPSATTVTAPEVGVPLGSSIVIKGTVMDVSPGTKDSGITMRFPNGVPAVADECMGEWMKYVYCQFPRPSDVKGVWVKIDAINVYTGEYIDVGGTHTDSAGFFTVMWTPPKEGLWTILATFPGSKAYYPSFAETSIGVTAAAPTPETPEIELPAPPDYTMIFAALALLVIIAILVGVYSIYSIRKLRK